MAAENPKTRHPTFTCACCGYDKALVRPYMQCIECDQLKCRRCMTFPDGRNVQTAICVTCAVGESVDGQFCGVDMRSMPCPDCQKIVDGYIKDVWKKDSDFIKMCVAKCKTNWLYKHEVD